LSQLGLRCWRGEFPRYTPASEIRGALGCMYKLLAARMVSVCACAALWLGVFLPVSAQTTPTETQVATQVTRHPLETRALIDPQGVLKQLPGLLQNASASKNYKELALLNLAQSNACRVIANWNCQSSAAERARMAAEMAALPELQVRALIAESRARIAMQDFTRGEQLLGEAERLLKLYPSPELSGDVFLAYSSLSNTLGKHALAAGYAKRGLTALSRYPALMIRIRLLRNQSRALTLLNDTASAQAALKEALALTEQVQDPKLSAELHLEDARIARLMGDVPTQQANGRRILALAEQLGNTQLTGLGHEVLGLAALSQTNTPIAEKELQIAYNSFHELKLARDERRALRALMQTMMASNQPRAELNALTLRLIELEKSLEADDRAQASDDFDARLKYAQQEFDVQQFKATSVLVAQREKTAAIQQQFILIMTALSILLILVLSIFYSLQRRSNARLKQVNHQLVESESRYRMLADNTRDLVVRMRLDGQRLYVSPSAKDLLGIDPLVLTQSRWELIHPDDREVLAAALDDIGQKGGSANCTYRIMHKDGHYVWFEALARLVPHPEGGGPAEIVYSGRDISARIFAEQALSLSDSRMRAITNNMPALISHVDKNERYLFINTYSSRAFGIDTEKVIGKTILEVRGESLYKEVKPYVDAVLRGEPVTFDGKIEVAGKLYYYQTSYVPERDSNGNVQGFFSLTLNITDLKLAEAALERLSLIDSMTEVANRRYFEERLNSALARGHRQHEAIGLLYLDIDHLKLINDNNGHAVGDAVIIAFAERLQACVRTEDLVARLGGDEFAVLIENPGPTSGEAIAKKFRTLMQQPIIIDGVKLLVSASVGVAYCAQAPSAKELMSLADKALYAAKSAGRATYQTVVGE
jgi:diguanylate cyclase (GGDEF)-like protein/PAS domain S-box-containing protein